MSPSSLIRSGKGWIFQVLHYVSPSKQRHCQRYLSLSRIDECFDSLGKSKIFSTQDANSGSGQIPEKDESRDKMAFVCDADLYRYKRMPFGLTNAQATFQRAQNVIFLGVKWKMCSVYLDALIGFSSSVDE